MLRSDMKKGFCPFFTSLIPVGTQGDSKLVGVTCALERCIAYEEIMRREWLEEDGLRLHADALDKPGIALLNKQGWTGVPASDHDNKLEFWRKLEDPWARCRRLDKEAFPDAPSLPN